jgi:hypothetical protein
MVWKAAHSVAAFLTVVLVGALVIPGCVIKLGKGERS